MNKDFAYLTQEETKRLLAAIPTKRGRALFLTAYLMFFGIPSASLPFRKVSTFLRSNGS